MGKRNKIKRTRSDSGPCGHKYYYYYYYYSALWPHEVSVFVFLLLIMGRGRGNGGAECLWGLGPDLLPRRRGPALVCNVNCTLATLIIYEWFSRPTKIVIKATAAEEMKPP